MELVILGITKVSKFGGMIELDKYDIRITLFNFMLIDATKLVSESMCIFPPMGTILISNTLKVDITFSLFLQSISSIFLS